MEKKVYHHGNLKLNLIEKGLQIINDEGYDNLSLRKVANVCGVSHTAPYKHFKNKNELIGAIYYAAIDKFNDYLISAINVHLEDIESQIIDLGKKYVQFMMENPDYMKFFFFLEKKNSIKLKDDKLIYDERSPFKTFHDIALKYIENIEGCKENTSARILSIWSLVHGISVLLVYKNIEYEGHYLDLVTKMLSGFYYKG